MLSVTIEYVKKRANISRQVKTLERMHKTPSKTKRKKSTLYYARKKSTPHVKKSTCNYFKAMPISIHGKQNTAKHSQD